MNYRLLLTRLVLIGAVVSGAFGIAPIAHAATGCTMYVSTTGDGNSADLYLTLREAILIANAGTSATGLNRAFSNSELAYLGAGCTWDGSNHLVAGGAGYVDTIRFNNTLGVNPTLTITSNLIALNDDSGDIIDGTYTNMYPTINAGSANFGLTLGKNHTVKGVRVTGAALYDFNIIDTGNTLINVAAWDAGEAGIRITADNNTVDGAVIGVANYNTSTCGADGNGQAGIEISTDVSFPSAKHNVIKNSTINCNGTAGTYPGILITGSGADNNTIGPNNKVGTNNWDGGVDLPNSGDGVDIAAGADYTAILTTTIGDNLGHGLSIADSSNTQIGYTWIRYNAWDGINISGTSFYTTIGGPSFANNLTGNVIGHNGHHGINLVGSNVRYTLLAGNEIGTLNGGKTDDGNSLSGVVVNGARTNYLGDEAAAHNFIGGNQLIGVLLTNGASGNTLGHMTIGTQQAPNLFYGIQVDGGSHDNLIGTDTLTVTYNALGNVLIQGSTTATNTVKSLHAHSSPGFGIALRNGTFNNTIGELGVGNTNTVSGNQSQGIEMSGGAHDNDVLNAWIVQNGHNGIRLTGTGTTSNVISATTLLANTYDGISEGNGAVGNMWSALYAAGNGGLAVDKNADSETTDEVNPSAAVIRSSVLANDVITITGTALPSNVFTAVKVDAYEIGVGTNGHLNLDYIGSSPVSITGTWVITDADRFLGTSCVAVIQTTTTNLLGLTRNSSEPSYTNCRTLLPVIRQ